MTIICFRNVEKISLYFRNYKPPIVSAFLILIVILILIHSLGTYYMLICSIFWQKTGGNKKIRKEVLIKCIIYTKLAILCLFRRIIFISSN